MRVELAVNPGHRGEAEPVTTALAKHAPCDRESGRNALGTALAFADNGFPVLPGSTFNGRRFVVEGKRITNGIRPIEPRNKATTDRVTIMDWWSGEGALKPTVFLRSGLVFDAITAPLDLAEACIKAPEFLDDPGPVVYRPDEGLAYFMVTLGTMPRYGFGRNAATVRLLLSGAVVLVPPAAVGVDSHARWLVFPEMTRWKLAKFDTVARLLAHTVIETKTRPVAGHE